MKTASFLTIGTALVGLLMVAGADRPGLSRAAAAQEPTPSVTIQLQPVVSSGLTSPIFTGNAGDGTNRLFIVEQSGAIKVLQPGSSMPTVFLNISSKVVFGGERGLLGLAFHPQYSSNRRFFVNYTRAGDGATVIAEYHGSAANPNIADTAETILLTVPQPFANHNGGMMAFGPDGFLYIAMGDGGGGNDPGNRAQNINELLGKILRIDVNNPAGGLPYSSPADNPFFGGTPGRDEIFAVGMRNPWRFSFDRLTGALFCGDVGQGAFEEIDIITRGGNYGWRVFEGFHCTNLDPPLCSSSGFTAPILEYGHTGGRCSVTGGYVYRGSTGALPFGSYVYADFCTGEIFLLEGSASSLLLDTSLLISSFGEDESGELYVVALGGEVFRIAGSGQPPPPPGCPVSISPTSRSFIVGGGSGTVAVTAAAGCTWSAVSNATWITINSGSGGSGNGSVGYSVGSNKLGTGPRMGTLTIGTNTFTVNQPGPGAACSVTLSPTGQTFSAAGGSGSFRVTAGSTCQWTAISGASFVNITSGSAATGNGTVAFSVQPNSGGASRQTSINVNGRLFTVTQAPCSFSLSPPSASFGAGGGTGSVNVTTTAGCSWSAASESQFITIDSGSTGSGSGTVSYSVGANTSSTSRSGTIRAAGLTFTVNQEGVTTPSCSFSISPMGASFGSGGGGGLAQVNTGAGCNWSAVSNASWISVTSGSGPGPGTVNFSVAANTDPVTRSGSLTIAGISFDVSQAAAPAGGGCASSLSPSSIFMSKSGSSSFIVNAPATCSWQAVSNESWITITSPTKSSGTRTISFNVASNTTGGPRSGTISVGGLTFTVNQ